MDDLHGRVADLLSREAQPLCARCVGELLGIPHVTARGTLDSIAGLDEFTYAERCRRCGGSDTVVEARAARLGADLRADDVA